MDLRWKVPESIRGYASILGVLGREIGLYVPIMREMSGFGVKSTEIYKGVHGNFERFRSGNKHYGTQFRRLKWVF